jgi:hypothetical protein
MLVNKELYNERNQNLYETKFGLGQLVRSNHIREGKNISS